MAFKVFSSGVLTSSDVNTFLMRQSVITCTASTRPAGPSEGMMIYETDTDYIYVYDGLSWQQIASTSSWTAFTPAVSGTGAALGNGTIAASYIRLGRAILYRGSITWGSTSTQPTASPNTINVSLPVNASTTRTTENHGVLAFFDISAGQNYAGVALAQAVTLQFFLHRDSPTTSLIDWLTMSSNVMSPTLATGDELRWNVVYEAAS